MAIHRISWRDLARFGPFCPFLAPPLGARREDKDPRPFVSDQSPVIRQGIHGWPSEALRPEAGRSRGGEMTLPRRPVFADAERNVSVPAHSLGASPDPPLIAFQFFHDLPFWPD